MMEDKIYWNNYLLKKGGSFKPILDKVLVEEDPIDKSIFSKYEYFDFELIYVGQFKYVGIL